MPAILYISSILPARSETFVYREVFALRARGLKVHTASVNPPEQSLGEARLDDLASHAIPIYSTGFARLLLDAALESLMHPIRATRTVLRALADVLACDDVPWRRRPRLLLQAIAGLALARRGRPLGITHIHAHMAHVPTTIAMVAARQLGIPFSFTGHANDIFPNRALLRPKLRRAAFVSCISRWHQSFYHEVAGVGLERLPVIRCGVDVPGQPANGADDPPSPRSDSLPAAVATPRDTTTDPRSPGRLARSAIHIVAVGRLIQKKGFDVLLEALALLGASHPALAKRILLSIAGDGPEMNALVAHASRVAPPSNALPSAQPSSSRQAPTIQLLGALPNPAVRTLMSTADLFVLPCRIDPAGDRDGIPVVLMEAMAAGIPVISGNLPAIAELVEHDSTGLMVPPGEAQPLADTLARILTDNALRARLAAAGRQRVIDEFSESVNIERLMFALGLGPGADRASDRARSG